jgi:murein DD-endopeptidase MepM/ murein hydrolase activator NlpD
VTGRVVEVDGKPTSYVVQKGDGLAKIARKLDSTVERLAKDNDLKPPFHLEPGQTLQGPPGKAHAYVVGADDTLEVVAKRFGISVESLRAENSLGRRGLQPGLKLRLPQGYRDRGPISVTTRVAVSGGPAIAEPAQDDAPPPPGARTEAAAVSRTVTERTVTGKVVEVAGKPTSYVVKTGDTLIRIADALDTTVQDLAKDNGLKAPYVLRPGQRLKGPAIPAKAYVVGPGDTPFSIAKRFSVTAEALKAQNGLKRSAAIRAGQKLVLPRGYRDKGPLTVTTRTSAPAEAPEPTMAPAPRAYIPPEPPPSALPASPQPYSPPPSAPQATAPTVRPYSPPPSIAGPVGGPTSAGALPDAQISLLGRGRFIWPLKGEIISDYGPKQTGQRNDGMNIAASIGDPVLAVASGDVVYAGDQVPGFGNLVLIKHADGWVTAYGHLSKVEVKMQQRVAQGQEIGLAGDTGGAPRPQLHFEVRYAPSPLERARPIDPTLVLPK